MIETGHHTEILHQALDILAEGSAQQEAVLAATVGLYGLRILAASGSYLARTPTTNFAQRWSSLKRETASIGAVLNRELATAGQALSVTALRYHPDYQDFRDDSLMRAILIFDRLASIIASQEDTDRVAQALQGFLTRRVRNQAATALSLATPAFVNDLGVQLLVEGWSAVSGGSYSVYDPACGVGGSLAALHRYMSMPGIQADENAYYGQDINQNAVFIAAWNLLLSGAIEIYLEVGDTLNEPRFASHGKLDRFDLVIAQPPAHYVTNEDFGSKDHYQRFRYGAVQSSRADYAFVQHIIASLLPEGRAVIIMPVTALSRSGFEEEIRAGLVHADILEASISFQGGLLLGKDTPAAILFFDLDKRGEGIFFLDAPVNKTRAMEVSTEPVKRTVQLIVDTIRFRQTRQGVARTATLDEIKARQYNLAPQAYVSRRGTHEVDVDALDQERTAITKELQEVQETFQSALLALRNERRRMTKKSIE